MHQNDMRQMQNLWHREFGVESNFQANEITQSHMRPSQVSVYDLLHLNSQIFFELFQRSGATGDCWRQIWIVVTTSNFCFFSSKQSVVFGLWFRSMIISYINRCCDSEINRNSSQPVKMPFQNVFNCSIECGIFFHLILNYASINWYWNQ